MVIPSVRTGKKYSSLYKQLLQLPLFSSKTVLYERNRLSDQVVSAELRSYYYTALFLELTRHEQPGRYSSSHTRPQVLPVLATLTANHVICTTLDFGSVQGYWLSWISSQVLFKSKPLNSLPTAQLLALPSPSFLSTQHHPSPLPIPLIPVSPCRCAVALPTRTPARDICIS